MECRGYFTCNLYNMYGTVSCLKTKSSTVVKSCGHMVDISKFSKGMNEQLLKVSALQKNPLSKITKKNLNGVEGERGGGWHPSPFVCQRVDID